MESYTLPLLLLVIILIIATFSIVYNSFDKFKRLFRKYFPVANHNRPDSVDKSFAPPFPLNGKPPLIPLEVLEVAELNQSSLLVSDSLMDPSLNPSTVTSSSAIPTCKTHTRKVRFDEEEATYIISTEMKREGRFQVATFSWMVDTSNTPETKKTKRSASVPTSVDALLKTEPGISSEDTLIMHRLPQNTSTFPRTKKTKRLASVPTYVESLLKTEPDISSEDTLIMYRLPQNNSTFPGTSKTKRSASIPTSADSMLRIEPDISKADTLLQNALERRASVF